VRVEQPQVGDHDDQRRPERQDRPHEEVVVEEVEPGIGEDEVLDGPLRRGGQHLRVGQRSVRRDRRVTEPRDERPLGHPTVGEGGRKVRRVESTAGRGETVARDPRHRRPCRARQEHEGQANDRHATHGIVLRTGSR
jgi:hypothetical protein